MTKSGRPQQEGEQLICPLALANIAAEVGSEHSQEFAAHFIGLWPSRRARLHKAFTQHDSGAMKDAALSLKSGAAMIGANPLASVAAEIHYTISQPRSDRPWNQAEILLHELDRLGPRTVEDLKQLLDACME